ncbi:MAG: outer membrane beta-barrel protein, partial [Xanthobacteraceae bacterium]
AKGGLGAAWDRYDIPGTFMGVQYDLQGSGTRLGWTAGAGLEWAFSSDWSVKLEYDYYGLGQRNVTFVEQFTATPGPENIKQNIQVVTLGINLHISPW